jgi:hypothetical protein
MKEKTVVHYICEFCGKVQHKRSSMARHEKHCTKNPNRECRMCDAIGESPTPMPELLAVLPDPKSKKYIDDKHRYAGTIYDLLKVDTEAALPKLRELTSNCPACMMAALRQRAIPVPMVMSFKEECGRFWKAVNGDRAAEVYHG